MNYQQAKTKIKIVRAKGGTYWTNIVGCILRQVAEDLGCNKANQLIRECNLEKDGWQEEKEED